jgi:ribonuclease G
MHERPGSESTVGVGDIYLGKVEAVVPGLQAAFVNIGAEKSAFLHASDLVEAEIDDEDNGDRKSRRYQPIQDLITQGQELLVQVTKEPIGTKGPRVTAQVSLPGRFIVYMPFSSHVGISRKIEARSERARLREMARDLLDEDSGGLIVRTVGEELTKSALKRELKTLQKTWAKIGRRAESLRAPALAHEETHLTSGIIRDQFSQKIDLLTVDSRDLAHEVKSYVGQVNPELLGRVKAHRGKRPIFDKFGVEEEIRRAFRYTGKKDPAQTILRTNMDAAVEVCRQLRLRDIGGIIVVDFIDMDDPAAREDVLQQVRSQLGRDRARTKVFPISDLGLMEMSRQRVRPSLHQTMTTACPYCDGDGRILAPETVVRRIERSLRRAASAGEVRDLTIIVHPTVALHLLEAEHSFMRDRESETGMALDVRDDPLLGLDQFRLLAAPADADVTSKYVLP